MILMTKVFKPISILLTFVLSLSFITAVPEIAQAATSAADITGISVTTPADIPTDGSKTITVSLQPAATDFKSALGNNFSWLSVTSSNTDHVSVGDISWKSNSSVEVVLKAPAIGGLEMWTVTSGVGSSTITVKANNLTKQITAKSYLYPLAVKWQTEVGSHIGMVKGDTKTLTYLVSPCNYGDWENGQLVCASNSVSWSSSAPNVASVSNGTIYANDFGTAAICATSTLNSEAKSCINVTVGAIANLSVDAGSVSGAWLYLDSAQTQRCKIDYNFNGGGNPFKRIVIHCEITSGAGAGGKAMLGFVNAHDTAQVSGSVGDNTARHFELCFDPFTPDGSGVHINQNSIPQLFPDGHAQTVNNKIVNNEWSAYVMRRIKANWNGGWLNNDVFPGFRLNFSAAAANHVNGSFSERQGVYTADVVNYFQWLIEFKKPEGFDWGQFPYVSSPEFHAAMIEPLKTWAKTCMPQIDTPSISVDKENRKIVLTNIGWSECQNQVSNGSASRTRFSGGKVKISLENGLTFSDNSTVATFNNGDNVEITYPESFATSNLDTDGLIKLRLIYPQTPIGMFYGVPGQHLWMNDFGKASANKTCEEYGDPSSCLLTLNVKKAKLTAIQKQYITTGDLASTRNPNFTDSNGNHIYDGNEYVPTQAQADGTAFKVGNCTHADGKTENAPCSLMPGDNGYDNRTEYLAQYNSLSDQLRNVQRVTRRYPYSFTTSQSVEYCGIVPGTGMGIEDPAKGWLTEETASDGEAKSVKTTFGILFDGYQNSTQIINPSALNAAVDAAILVDQTLPHASVNLTPNNQNCLKHGGVINIEESTLMTHVTVQTSLQTDLARQRTWEKYCLWVYKGNSPLATDSTYCPSSKTSTENIPTNSPDSLYLNGNEAGTIKKKYTPLAWEASSSISGALNVTGEPNSVTGIGSCDTTMPATGNRVSGSGCNWWYNGQNNVTHVQPVQTSLLPQQRVISRIQLLGVLCNKPGFDKIVGEAGLKIPNGAYDQYKGKVFANEDNFGFAVSPKVMIPIIYKSEQAAQNPTDVAGVNRYARFTAEQWNDGIVAFNNAQTGGAKAVFGSEDNIGHKYFGKHSDYPQTGALISDSAVTTVDNSGFYDKECPVECTSSSADLPPIIASAGEDATINNTVIGTDYTKANVRKTTTNLNYVEENKYGVLLEKDTEANHTNGSILSFFRFNVDRTVKFDLWYPKNSHSESAADLKKAVYYDGRLPLSTTIVQWNKGTPDNSFFKAWASSSNALYTSKTPLFAGTDKQPYQSSLAPKNGRQFMPVVSTSNNPSVSTEIPVPYGNYKNTTSGNSGLGTYSDTIAGLKNKLVFRSSWASDNNLAQMFNINWEYQIQLSPNDGTGIDKGYPNRYGFEDDSINWISHSKDPSRQTSYVSGYTDEVQSVYTWTRKVVDASSWTPANTSSPKYSPVKEDIARVDAAPAITVNCQDCTSSNTATGSSIQQRFTITQGQMAKYTTTLRSNTGGTVTLRVSNADDFYSVFVNGQPLFIATATFEDSGPQQIVVPANTDTKIDIIVHNQENGVSGVGDGTIYAWGTVPNPGSINFELSPLGYTTPVSTSVTVIDPKVTTQGVCYGEYGTETQTLTTSSTATDHNIKELLYNNTGWGVENNLENRVLGQGLTTDKAFTDSFSTSVVLRFLRSVSE